MLIEKRYGHPGADHGQSCYHPTTTKKEELLLYTYSGNIKRTFFFCFLPRASALLDASNGVAAER
jgi:hypothetical protein